MDYENEITVKLRADFSKIAQTFPKGSSMLYIRPYASGSVINVSEQMSAKYGKPYNYFLQIVDPIANALMKEYFG